MRKNPKYKSIMPALDDPHTLGIVNILMLYRKYCFETETQHVNEIMNKSKYENDEFELSEEATVLLM